MDRYHYPPQGTLEEGETYLQVTCTVPCPVCAAQSMREVTNAWYCNGCNVRIAKYGR